MRAVPVGCFDIFFAGTYDDIVVKLQAAHESVYGRSDWEPAKQAVVALISFFHAQIFMLPDDALMERYNHMCQLPHTNTRAVLEEQQGLILNGPFLTGGNAR
eukprot:TRINITY_DN4184_c1_g2_i1.p3 TRINITY_DN4184_c1_g2~~TRINITY_DN4184_c1_g2_i1.p3  ORF type:complete len:102 (-),score=10.88 TRINITY_DN4184_c1_g2_i1:183-488(-)